MFNILTTRFIVLIILSFIAILPVSIIMILDFYFDSKMQAIYYNEGFLAFFHQELMDLALVRALSRG